MYALEVKSLTKDYGLNCGVWYLIGYIIGYKKRFTIIEFFLYIGFIGIKYVWIYRKM